MSLQVCYCGWSKVTTYHGLRTHQGKMGCTPKGMRIPESEQFRFSYSPRTTYKEPPIKINTTSDMSLQVCIYCGWSKVTTYHGLRIHQGKMGCTPKGLRIPESEQFSINRYSPKLTYVGPSIKVDEPLTDIVTPQVKPYGDRNTLISATEEALQKDNATSHSTSVKTQVTDSRDAEGDTGGEAGGGRAGEAGGGRGGEAGGDGGEEAGGGRGGEAGGDVGGEAGGSQPFLTFGSPASPAVRETNNSLFQTPQVSYPTATNVCRALDFNSGPQQIQQPFLTFGSPASPAVRETNNSLFQTPQHSYPTANVCRALDFNTGPQQIQQVGHIWNIPTTTAQDTLFQIKEEEKEKEREAKRQLNPLLTFGSPASPAVMETNDSLFQTPQLSYPTTTNVCRALDFNTGPQQIQQVQQVWNIPTITAQDTLFQIKEVEMETEREAQRQLKPFLTFGSPASPAVMETNDSLFQTPPHSYPTATNVCRALDFNTGPQQIQQVQHVWNTPTTTAQDTLFQINQEEKEKEREAQRQLKARQDSKRADLQQKIQWREQKMTEARSSVTASTDSLDAEWQEINSVFSGVMRVVEDTWQKALRPLEERRQRLEREAQDLFQMLQNEIDKLRKTIDELDQNPDLQVSPLKGVDESRDWRNVTVDGSFSPGTLRSSTSDMMEQIQQKLEKLSSIELKRVATFAVDVKLDPTTAHSYLVVSPDGKTVKDGDQDQKVPAAPGRFDKFGSVLGLNRLKSGKSYWEVEVTRKTGWDLGVARCDASRKGNLSLTPKNGYWVTVHFEDQKYAALTAPPISLSLTVKPQKVGVFVDYDEGLVSFYDVTAQSHIYSFTRCSFGGEISPYFSPHLHRNGKNSEPLIISAVKIKSRDLW